MGIKQRREREKQEVRQGTLTAAREIALHEGWQAVTIRKVAERIEYSPSMIYEYFANFFLLSVEQCLIKNLCFEWKGKAESIMASKTFDEAGLALPAVRVSGRGFDWTMAGLSIWWMGGLFVDGWAHANIPQLETFFTPWHAIFYSGFFAVATALAVQVLLNLRRAAGSNLTWVALIRQSLATRNWLKAIPRGYGLTALGLIIFLVSGVGDMTWHIFLGIERSTEALLSPTHLGLATGLGLSLSGPLRSAWRRSGSPGTWRELAPAIVSLTFTFSLLTFFIAYADALVHLWPLESLQGSATNGITDILLTTGLTMGVVLLAVRRWKLPFGTFTIMLGLNGSMMAVFSPHALIIASPTGILGGLAADLLYRFLQPALKEPGSVHLFAFLVPFCMYVVYFLDLVIVGPIFYHTGIAWSTPFWAGAPVVAGIAGFLLSFVMIPPAGVQEEERAR